MTHSCSSLSQGRKEDRLLGQCLPSLLDTVSIVPKTIPKATFPRSSISIKSTIQEPRVKTFLFLQPCTSPPDQGCGFPRDPPCIVAQPVNPQASDSAIEWHLSPCVTAALKGIFSRLAAFGGGDVEVWEGGALRAGFGQGCVMQWQCKGMNAALVRILYVTLCC
jgi:hypothetical protein